VPFEQYCVEVLLTAVQTEDVETLELLGTELDEDALEELDTTDELLGAELDEDALEELDTTDELLGREELLGAELDEDTALIVNVPQELIWPLQFPEANNTSTGYVPTAGLVQVGEFSQIKPLVTDVDKPLLLMQVTDGCVIAMPAVPDEGKPVQVGVYVILE